MKRPLVHLHPLPFDFSLGFSVKREPPSPFVATLNVLKYCDKVSPEPSLLQREKN